MAIPKYAQVTSSQPLGPHTQLLELHAEAPLGFVGGQYVIVDSGLTLPSGKAVKRAYSLLGNDREQQRLQLAVLRLPEGPGSGYMHALEPGARIAFSGPWGKMFVPEAPAPAPGPTVIVATDTGITAALGLVRSRRMQPLLAQTELIWLHVAGEAFLPAEFVRERVPAGCGALRIETIAPSGDAQRIVEARALLQASLGRQTAERVFICGDGAVNYALLDDVTAAGVACTRDNLESFFNMPKKSVPAPQTNLTQGA